MDPFGLLGNITGLFFESKDSKNVKEAAKYQYKAARETHRMYKAQAASAEAMAFDMLNQKHQTDSDNAMMIASGAQQAAQTNLTPIILIAGVGIAAIFLMR